MKCEKCGAESAGRLCLKCSSEQNELPIPASFFSPEESAGRHSFTLSDDAGQGGFTITAQSLQIEAVNPEAPEASAPLPELTLPEPPKAPEPQQKPSPAPPKQPQPRRSTPAPAPAAPAEPIQTPQGFYLVPYDESLWATLSRIRHRWLLPVLVGIIFIAGMTFGIMMARSSAKKHPAEESSAAVTTAPPEKPASSLTAMPIAQMQLYFAEKLLPEYGCLPNGTEISAADAEGILCAYCAGEQMTVLRLADGSLHIERFVLKNDKVEPGNETVYAEMMQKLTQSDHEITITGNASGIYFGGSSIAEEGLGTAESDAPVTLCVCRKNAEDSFVFTDLTDIRRNIGNPYSWQSAYSKLLRDTLAKLPEDSSARFRLVKIDGDSTPELELRIRTGNTTVARLYTAADLALLPLTTGTDASGYDCAPGQNCFREMLFSSEGTVYNWYHIENGKAVRDHTERLTSEDGEWIYYLDGEQCPEETFYTKTEPDASILEEEAVLNDLTEAQIAALTEE